MGYKRFETDQRVIVSVADLLQDRLENITYKPGTVLGLLHLMEVPGCTALCCFDYSSS
jgi:hypothetical protein